jgi:tRNA(Ile)-lysidine synthase
VNGAAARAGALAPWLARLGAIDDLVAARSRVVVACSGGADSLALLALACASGLDPLAVYVDHGLRAGSAHDAVVVRDAAARLGAAVDVSRVQVAHGPNLEARARDARYGALDAARVVHSARAVLVGHTLDDQAETVLLNVLRGGATSGLAGMAPERGTLRRPMLRLRRAETAEICRRLGLAPVADAMNHDVRYRRVWLRREVIPRLEAAAGRDLRPVLARQADVARDEAALLDRLAADAASEVGDPPSARRLLDLDPALARRVVRRWLGPRPPSLARVEGVLEVAHGARRAAGLGDGRRVERAGGRLSVVVTGASTTPATRATPALAPVPVALPGRAERGEHVLDAWVEHAAPARWPDGRSTAVLDAEAVGSSAVLRAVAPGDRVQPLGLGGSKPVREVLAEAGVPAANRAGQLVLAAGDDAAAPAGSPLWVVGYRIDHRVRVTSRTRAFLWITVHAGGSA